ncbi:serine protease 7-like [Haemaphysalis longicornis]
MLYRGTHTKPEEIWVRYNTTKWASGAYKLVEEAIPHPNYDNKDPANHAYDIAILKVERPLVFDDFVKPICLPLKKYRIQDKLLVVAGWGHMAPDKPSPVLLRTTLKGLDFITCELTYHIRKYGFEDSKSICAKPERGQFCQGDSGGPMTIKEKDGRSVLLGVIQSGNSCYPANSTSLGTRVSGFMSWIKKEIHRWE